MKKFLLALASILALLCTANANAVVEQTQVDTWYADFAVGDDWDAAWQDAAQADGLPRGMDKLDVTSAYCTTNPIARVQYPWGVLYVNYSQLGQLGRLVYNVLIAQQTALCLLNNAGFHH